MGERVIHVMTHDSIGLGEDGPTHQPVEHLAALRAIPNLNVFRPCDAVETLECWQLALEGARDGRACMALTRQNLPQLRRTLDERNKCVAGAYEISPARGQGAGFDLRHRLGGVHRGRRRRSSSPRRASRPASSRCRASSCSWRHSDEARRAVIGDAPVEDRRRGRGPAWAGTPSSARTAPSSA